MHSVYSFHFNSETNTVVFHTQQYHCCFYVSDSLSCPRQSMPVQNSLSLEGQGTWLPHQTEHRLDDFSARERGGEGEGREGGERGRERERQRGERGVRERGEREGEGER